MDQQISQRGTDNAKKHIVLMDGQPSLWEAAKKYFTDDYIEILDLLHATPRLWDVANMLHHNDDEKLEFIRQPTSISVTRLI